MTVVNLRCHHGDFHRLKKFSKNLAKFRIIQNYSELFRIFQNGEKKAGRARRTGETNLDFTSVLKNITFHRRYDRR